MSTLMRTSQSTPTIAHTTLALPASDPRQLGDDIHFVQAKNPLSANTGQSMFAKFLDARTTRIFPDCPNRQGAEGASVAAAVREAALDSDSSRTSSQDANSRDSSAGPSTAPTTPPESQAGSVKDDGGDEDNTPHPRENSKPEQEPEGKAKQTMSSSSQTLKTEGVGKKEKEMIATSEKPEKGHLSPRKETTTSPVKRKAADDGDALGAPASQRVKSQTNGEANKKAKVRGIMNPHFLCYRNSALQLLASCKIFRDELAKHKAGGCKVKGACVACGLATFFADHFRPGGKGKFMTNPTKPVAGFKQALPRPFNRLQGQEDAFEYITAVLSTIEDQLTKGLPESEKKSHPVYRAFNGCFPSVVKCSVCGHESSNNNEGVSMVMEPLTPTSEREVIPLRRKLIQYFRAEVVEYKCEKCNKPGGKATKRITIRSGPEFLIINIARHKPAKFAWKKGAKVRNHVSFGEALALPEIGADGKRKMVQYKLQSVLAHAGSTMSGGHYISFVQQPDGAWAECNDESVMEVPLKSVLSCDDGHYQACVLGYSKVHNCAPPLDGVAQR